MTAAQEETFAHTVDGGQSGGDGHGGGPGHYGGGHSGGGGHHGGAHADGGAHAHDGAPHGTFKGYVTGFVLSVFLTAIPFWLVMDMPLPNPQTVAFIVVGFAIVQIMVHMVFFLHLDPRSEGGWVMLSLVFTVIVVVIAIAGTLWVMYHLNTNMMPEHELPGR